MRSFPVGYELVVFGVHSGAGRRGVFYFSSEAYDETSLSRNEVVMSYGQQETTMDMLKFSRSGRRSWTAT